MSHSLREEGTFSRTQAFHSTIHGTVKRGRKNPTEVEGGSRVTETKTVRPRMWV